MVLQEQLRPETWDDFVGLDQEYARGITERDVLRKLFTEDEVQLVILAGPSGCGKTSAALLCAKDYLGDNMRLCIRTNASDERGINMVRRMRDEANRRTGDKRIVYIIDEFGGSLTPTQRAFSAIIEERSANAVFILIVNDIDRVIVPIRSRATVFKFPPLSRTHTIEWIKKTAVKLNTTLFAGIAEKLYTYYNGDLRKIVSDFFTKYKGNIIKDWNPPPTYAEEIYKAAKPFDKYLELRQEVYIEPVHLLQKLFILNNYENEQLFAVASNNIITCGLRAEFVNMAMALKAIKK